MDKLSIGEMAKMNNISIQALRLYDELGILKPIEVNQQTGYRYYDVRQSAHLDMIQYMKTTGMSLKEIKEVFQNNDLNHLNDILHVQLMEIDNKIEELYNQKKAIKKMISSYNRYLKSPPDGTITLEYIEERKIYPSKLGLNIYDYGIEVYENILRRLKVEIEENNISDIYYYNAGTTIAKDDFLNEKFKSKEVFVFVDQEYRHDHLRSLPASMYLCMYCDDFDKEKEYIETLYKRIEQLGLEVCGDYICEVLAELPITQTNKREMFLRLQIPINFVKK